MFHDKNERAVCLFAAFDPRLATDGDVRILPSTLHYVTRLAEAGLEVHLAISGARRLHADDRSRFEALGVTTHLRRNTGLDFGAWQDLIRAGCADGADRVLLANDSVFGPLSPLPPILSEMQRRQVDVWGMVETREARWHLQSWFLCFTARGFSSPGIRRIFGQSFHAMTREEIILHGELGLGAAIQADGLSWAARFRAPTRRLRRLIPGNPMHLDYLSVVRSGAVPFLKADLLRDNPAGIGWLGDWPTLLREKGDFPAHLIEQALRERPGTPKGRQSLRVRALYAAISSDRREAVAALLR